MDTLRLKRLNRGSVFFKKLSILGWVKKVSQVTLKMSQVKGIF